MYIRFLQGGEWMACTLLSSTDQVQLPALRQPRGKWVFSLVNSHTNATSKWQHLWKIDLRGALNSTPGSTLLACSVPVQLVSLLNTVIRRWTVDLCWRSFFTTNDDVPRSSWMQLDWQVYFLWETPLFENKCHRGTSLIRSRPPP